MLFDDVMRLQSLVARLLESHEHFQSEIFRFSRTSRSLGALLYRIYPQYRLALIVTALTRSLILIGVGVLLISVTPFSLRLTTTLFVIASLPLYLLLEWQVFASKKKTALKVVIEKQEEDKSHGESMQVYKGEYEDIRETYNVLSERVFRELRGQKSQYDQRIAGKDE